MVGFDVQHFNLTFGYFWFQIASERESSIKWFKHILMNSLHLTFFLILKNYVGSSINPKYLSIFERYGVPTINFVLCNKWNACKSQLACIFHILLTYSKWNFCLIWHTLKNRKYTYYNYLLETIAQNMVPNTYRTVARNRADRRNNQPALPYSLLSRRIRLCPQRPVCSAVYS